MRTVLFDTDTPWTTTASLKGINDSIKMVGHASTSSGSARSGGSTTTGFINTRAGLMPRGERHALELSPGRRHPPLLQQGDLTLVDTGQGAELALRQATIQSQVVEIEHLRLSDRSGAGGKTKRPTPGFCLT